MSKAKTQNKEIFYAGEANCSTEQTFFFILNIHHPNRHNPNKGWEYKFKKITIAEMINNNKSKHNFLLRHNPKNKTSRLEVNDINLSKTFQQKQ